MLIRFSSLLLALLVINQANSQSINVGSPLNTALTSEASPSLSGNGRTIIYTSTIGDDSQPMVVTSSSKGGVWSKPEVVPNLNSATGKIAAPKDIFLSYDGSMIFFSSPKRGGVGGTDIWFMEKNGTGWAAPLNLGAPVNSAGNESDPSLSSDGRFLYFTKFSDKKTPSGKPCGKIYISERQGKNSWKAPKELPTNINSGCECGARILADNQTMIFASTRSGGKGGLDYYKTALQEDGVTWSTPVAMAFVNTDKDDLYFSISALGDYVYHEGPSKSGSDIFKTNLPADFKPKKTMALEGVVKDGLSQAPINATVTLYDVKKNKIVTSFKSDANGRFYLYMLASGQYDFSIIAPNKNYSYYSEFYNLDTLSKFKELRTDMKLSPLSKSMKVNLKNIVFEEGTDKISSKSNSELGRIQKILTDNPTLQIEIGVHTDKVTIDSVQHPGLTELIIDSIEVPDPSDTTGLAKMKMAKKIYHNDITQKRADAVVAALTKRGISKDKIIGKGYGDKQPLPNSSGPNSFINKRFELTVIKP